jgi:Calcineurin-like phosphoesterase
MLTKLLFVALATGATVYSAQIPGQSTGAALPPVAESVRAIGPPAQLLPPEDATRDLDKVSFIVYGDTRGGATDGQVVHPVHSELMERIITLAQTRANSERAIRFVLQTGDAVLRGSDARMWNVSYTPVIERLTIGAGIPYFLTLGNHDVLAGRGGGANGREISLRAMANLYPPIGSARRLGDTAAYAFGIGPLFVLSIDSNVADDPAQLAWASAQLASLNRKRFKTVAAFLHHAPYSSGPHGAVLEPQTLAVRSLWMPLLRKHHVRLLLAGHEHFYERWRETYRDAGRTYRMDIVVTGGGGAPSYSYRGEPDLGPYLAAGAASQVRVEHLVKPGLTNDDNPHHFVVFDIDRDDIEEEVVSLGDRPLVPFKGKARHEL